MAKVKLTKAEKKIKALEALLKRREREIAACNRDWQQEIAKLNNKNRMTRFQIESIQKGEWPL